MGCGGQRALDFDSSRPLQCCNNEANSKVCGPSMVTLFNSRHIYEWHMAHFVIMS